MLGPPAGGASPDRARPQAPWGRSAGPPACDARPKSPFGFELSFGLLVSGIGDAIGLIA